MPLDVFGAVTIPLKWNPLERERKKQGVNNFNLNKIGHGHYRVYKKKTDHFSQTVKGGKRAIEKVIPILVSVCMCRSALLVPSSC